MHQYFNTILKNSIMPVYPNDKISTFYLDAKKYDLESQTDEDYVQDVLQQYAPQNKNSLHDVKVPALNRSRSSLSNREKVKENDIPHGTRTEAKQISTYNHIESSLNSCNTTDSSKKMRSAAYKKGEQDLNASISKRKLIRRNSYTLNKEKRAQDLQAIRGNSGAQVNNTDSGHENNDDHNSDSNRRDIPQTDDCRAFNNATYYADYPIDTYRSRRSERAHNYTANTLTRRDNNTLDKADKLPAQSAQSEHYEDDEHVYEQLRADYTKEDAVHTTQDTKEALRNYKVAEDTAHTTQDAKEELRDCEVSDTLYTTQDIEEALRDCEADDTYIEPAQRFGGVQAEEDLYTRDDGRVACDCYRCRHAYAYGVQDYTALPMRERRSVGKRIGSALRNLRHELSLLSCMPRC